MKNIKDFFKLIWIIVFGNNNLFTISVKPYTFVFQRSKDINTDIKKIQQRKNFDVVIDPNTVRNLPLLKKLHKCFVVTFRIQNNELIPVLFSYSNEHGWVEKDCTDKQYFLTMKDGLKDSFVNKFYLIEKL